MSDSTPDSTPDSTGPNDLLELAWGVIANGGGGDWTRETAEWQEAAARWREKYFAHLDAMGKAATSNSDTDRVAAFENDLRAMAALNERDPSLARESFRVRYLPARRLFQIGIYEGSTLREALDDLRAKSINQEH